MTDMMAAAVAYACVGVPVFPCAVGGKPPWTDNGFLDASTDLRTITTWWQRHPHANVAAPTGAATFDVLDIDVRASGNGWDALEQFKAAGLVDGWQRAIRTPRAAAPALPGDGAAQRQPG